MKSSWSEEDETNSCHLKTLFENLAKDIKHEFRIISDNDRDKYTAWLKSLKDRYTWKPSKVQLECLHDAINHYHANGYPASKLNELYEQMSKIYKL